MIVDPFDQTYNPGKQIYNDKSEEYNYRFAHFARRIEQKGTIGLSLSQLVKD